MTSTISWRCGIEIIAEPPGKEVAAYHRCCRAARKHLTAISLLFALLKINPSPVCILDEIDAALDEANVDKFSEYLQKYTREDAVYRYYAQKTDNGRICDSLYGFAMEEKGRIKAAVCAV